MNEMSAFINEASESSLLPCKDTVKRLPSMNKEVSSLQAPNQLMPLTLDFPASKTVRDKYMLFQPLNLCPGGCL